MLNGQVALVTGAGRGIGREIAISMAKNGATVIVNHSPSDKSQTGGAELAEKVAAEIKGFGGKAVANSENAADWDGAQRLVTSVIDSFAQLDIVVNSAEPPPKVEFSKITPEQFQSVVQGHLLATMFVSRAATIEFRRQERGTFIHLTSTAGLYGDAGQSDYAAVRMGILGLSNSLVLELQKSNVRSNVIAIDHEPTAADSASAAALAILLASEHCTTVTGQILGARGAEIHLYDHPRPVRFLHHKGGWTPEMLLEAVPKLERFFTPVAPARTLMPWDPN